MEKAKKKLILVTENLKFLTLYLSQKSFNGNLIWFFFAVSTTKITTFIFQFYVSYRG